jgi:4-amino-4-deoxy-L-arabinose transferase-like glycosyltransferase
MTHQSENAGRPARASRRALSTTRSADPPATPSRTLADRLEAFLTDRHRTIILAIVVVSAVVRAIYFLQLSAGPSLYQHRSTLTDMNFFDLWAQRIATGDLLTKEALHPMHDWHQRIAEAYFTIRPDQAKLLLSQWKGPGASHPAATLLWNRWFGQRTFHQEPLYPYMLATFYKLLGHDVRWVFLWQMLVSMGGNVLVYILARRYFGDLVAVLAAALVVLCGPLLYYDMLLLRESMIGPAGLLLVYLTERARDRPTKRRWMVLGSAFGLVILLKSYLLLMLAVVLGFLVTTQRRTPRTMAIRAGALVGGMLVVLSPAVLRNVAVGTGPFRLSSVGPITFVCNNTPDYPADAGFFISERYAPGIMAKAEGRFLPCVMETLKMYDNPLGYVRKLAAKFAAVWHWYEVPNNANFYYYRLHAGILLYLPVTFWLISPLALVGLALGAKRVGRCWPLYALVVTTIVILVIFGTFSRLRAPLLAPLAMFAALTVAQLMRWVGQRRLLHAAGLLALIAAVSLWTGRPLPKGREMIRAFDYITPYTVDWTARINEADSTGHHAQAVALLERSLRFEPGSVRHLGPLRHAGTADEMELAAFYTRIHKAYGQALAKVDRSQESQAQFRRAEELTAATAP